MRAAQFIAGIAAMLVVAGCGGFHSVASAPTIAKGRAALPMVFQSGKSPHQWTRFKTNLAPATIITGPDLNLWLPDPTAKKLIKMTMTGTTHAFPTSTFSAKSIVVGSDNNFYMMDCGGPNVIVVTTAGVVTSHAIPSGDSGCGLALDVASDGNVWFEEKAHVGNITPSGVITELASIGANNTAAAMATDFNGYLWYGYCGSVNCPGQVVQVNPFTGAMVPFTVNCSGAPQSMTPGADGNLWFACSGNNGSHVVSLSTYGVSTIYPSAGIITQNSANVMTTGADGNPWYVSGVGSNAAINRIDLSTNIVTSFLTPTSGGIHGVGLAQGSDGNMWMLDSANSVDVYIINILSVQPKSVRFTGVGQTKTLTATETGNPTLTATTSKPAVATVTPGQAANTFVVKSTGAGSCKIAVMDAIGNSFSVAITVL